MPGLDELTWVEYVDFTGGLWERGNDRECAPNGLLEATDCFPLPSGGLKAFAKFKPMRTGFTSTLPAEAYVLGIWCIAAASNLVGGLYCMTMAGTTAPYTFTLWRLITAGLPSFGIGPIPEAALDTASVSATPGAWSPILTRTDITTIETAINMTPYRTSTVGGGKVYFNFPITTPSTAAVLQQGIWQTDNVGTTAVFAFNNPFAPAAGEGFFRGVWTHQARLLSLTGESGGSPYTQILYTDAGSSAQPTTANFLQPLGEAPSRLNFVSPYAPSDLYFMKEQLAFGSVQGALTAPTVRQLGYTHLFPRGFPVQTNIGLVMVIFNEGVYAWTGDTMEHISQSILGDAMGGTPCNATDSEEGATTEVGSDLIGAPNWTLNATHSTGQLGCYEHFIFFNNGYVLDSRTGAWFKQSSAPGARCWTADPHNRRVYVSCNNRFNANASPTPHTMFWSRMGEAAWTSHDVYSFTLPLIYSFGHKTNLSQLEYHVNAFNDSSTLEVELSYLDGSTEVTMPLKGPFALARGSSQVRVNVGGHPAVRWKVRTTLRSRRSGTAAPTLERMFCGVQQSTRYQEADAAEIEA